LNSVANAGLQYGFNQMSGGGYGSGSFTDYSGAGYGPGPYAPPK
jgi:hypothetical protein